ncbi:MAG: anti-sigma factor domain-containing protein [Janthinobacterium lividum]
MTEIHGATGVYVLDALEADELEEFEAHRAVCSTCSREVAEFCETAPRLSVLAAAPAPPPALRASILSGLSDVRQLPPLHGDVLQQRPRAGDELALRRSSRRARVLSVLVAAVSVLAVALGGTVYSLARQQQAPVTAGPSSDASLLAAPDAQIVPLALSNGAQVSFVVSKSQNRALFVGGDLPAPGPGKTYELWTVHGRTVTPDNLVPGGTNVSQWLRGSIKDSTAVAVSVEDAGGSTVPTAVQGAIKI